MNTSIWRTWNQKPSFEKLRKNLTCDILVIGGGLAGILTAYYLKKNGADVVLVEAREVGRGITANTTAFITAQHDTTYTEFIKMHGLEAARDYLEANLSAVEEYRRIVADIDCDFQLKPSYRYSLDKDLKDEVSTLKKLGYHKAELTDVTGLPFKIKSAVRFPDMGVFHPLKFCYSLLDNLKIYEETRILDVKDHTAFTDRNRIEFKQAVVATHFPFIDRRGWFFAKMYQERSYVVALEKAWDVQGMYNEDKPRGLYWRNYENLLIVGMGDHRTGTRTEAPEELVRYVKRLFPKAPIKYSWANQDCVTLDSMPYIGRYGSFRDIYTLTGFNLWGMTGAMTGALILKDLLTGRQNKFQDTFRPDRSIMRTQLLKNIISTVGSYIKPTGKRCPHLGCALKYNKREHSWDCSCHGSRFEENGILIENPSNKDAKI